MVPRQSFFAKLRQHAENVMRNIRAKPPQDFLFTLCAKLARAFGRGDVRGVLRKLQLNHAKKMRVVRPLADQVQQKFRVGIAQLGNPFAHPATVAEQARNRALRIRMERAGAPGFRARFRVRGLQRISVFVLVA